MLKYKTRKKCLTKANTLAYYIKKLMAIKIIEQYWEILGERKHYPKM